MQCTRGQAEEKRQESFHYKYIGRRLRRVRGTAACGLQTERRKRQKEIEKDDMEITCKVERGGDRKGKRQRGRNKGKTVTVYPLSLRETKAMKGKEF